MEDIKILNYLSSGVCVHCGSHFLWSFRGWSELWGVELIGLIASKQNNAAKKRFSFSFAAFEESGMLESDEVF